MDTDLKWLMYDAKYEVDQMTWYNLIAKYVLNDKDTDLCMTPSEAGWED